jgi:uncharacterized protein (DUF1330 family)
MFQQENNNSQFVVQMVAYAIVDLEVFDIERYLDYQQAVRPLLQTVGAHYLARGGEHRVLEGDYRPHRLIVIEFPSLEVMEDFYESEAYQSLEAQRRACSRARILGVEGL